VSHDAGTAEVVGEEWMARYKPFNLKQDKFIALSDADTIWRP